MKDTCSSVVAAGAVKGSSTMPDANQVGTQQETAERSITVTRGYSISMPETEPALIIPISELNRIMEMVERIPPENRWFPAAGWTCIGISFSAVFDIVGFAALKNVPFWAQLVSWSAAVCGAVLAAAFFWLDRQSRSKIVQSTRLATDELKKLCQGAEPNEESRNRSDKGQR
jgi:hypothetical protein